MDFTVAVQLSSDQMLHQQKQAANAVAQSLSGNSGLTVRLISPGQVCIEIKYGGSHMLPDLLLHLVLFL